MADKEEVDAEGNELQNMLDKVVENAHARLDMAADILRAAVSSIPPEELAKLLFAAMPQQQQEAANTEPTEAPTEEAGKETAPAADAPAEEEAPEAEEKKDS